MPRTVHSGAPFPDRDLIVFVTAGVIVVTLLQALALPSVVRWARLPQDTTMDDERHAAETLATEQALAAIPELAAQLGTDAVVVERVQREHEKHLRVLRAGDPDADDEPALRRDQHYVALHLATIAHKRATIVGLRDKQSIDDTVLRQLQNRLDLEEVRLTRDELLE